MKNSLTICQLHVSQVLENIPKDILLIHDMNDLLLAHSDAVYLQRTAENVLKGLASLHLMVVQDKVESKELIHNLPSSIVLAEGMTQINSVPSSIKDWNKGVCHPEAGCVSKARCLLASRFRPQLCPPFLNYIVHSRYSQANNQE